MATTALATRPPQPATGIVLAAAAEPASPSSASPTAAIPTSTRPKLNYAQLETLPIDLPTVVRLLDENSPVIGFAQARVREAQARQKLSELQWIPNLSFGATYSRFDGQTQNQGGSVFGVSRSNLFGSIGPGLNLDVAEAIYRPLIERRNAAAVAFQSQTVALGSELDAVTAYLDLVQLYASREINAETISNAELMLQAAQNAKDAKLDRTAGDVNRAVMEVLFRKTERAEIEARIGTASARLGRLLLLPPNVKLIPAETVIAPVTLIDPRTSLDELVNLAVGNRPDLAAHREAIQASLGVVRKAQHGPLLPRVALANQTGIFGGGVNANLSQFESRNQLGLQLSWELRNLGLGNRAEVAERRAILDESRFQLQDAQARAIAEIVETAQMASARAETLELAERSVKEASELYRINKESTKNVVDAKNLFDALRPLQSIQMLNQAQQAYLNAVLDFNKAQYRLLTLVGIPARQGGLPGGR
jgi:outer membrane protein TolC